MRTGLSMLRRQLSPINLRPPEAVGLEGFMSRIQPGWVRWQTQIARMRADEYFTTQNAQRRSLMRLNRCLQNPSLTLVPAALWSPKRGRGSRRGRRGLGIWWIKWGWMETHGSRKKCSLKSSWRKRRSETSMWISSATSEASNSTEWRTANWMWMWSSGLKRKRRSSKDLRPLPPSRTLFLPDLL